MSIYNKRQSPNDAIQSALGAIRSAPQYLTSTIGTSAQTLPQLGVADAASGQGTRRVRLLNKHDTQYLGIALEHSGDNAGAPSIDDTTQVAPGQTLEMLVGANMRIYLVGSGADTSFNLTVHDLL